MAQEAYRRALAVAPDTADVKLNLSLSLALSGKVADAIAQLHPLVGETGSTDVSSHDLAAALTVAGHQVEANLVLRGDPRPADPEAPPAVANPPERPLVAVASVAGHSAMTPDAAASPLLDIRPAPVMAVMGVPGFDASGSPRTVAAPTLHQAQLTAPIQAAGIERPSGQDAVGPTKPAATMAGVVQATSRVVGAGPQLPSDGIHDPPTGPAHTARSSVPITIAPGFVSRVGTALVAVSSVAVSSAAVSPAAASSVAISAMATTPRAVTPVTVAPVTIASGEFAAATVAPLAVAPVPIALGMQPKSAPTAPTVEHFTKLVALDGTPRTRTEWQHPQSQPCDPMSGGTYRVGGYRVRRREWRDDPPRAGQRTPNLDRAKHVLVARVRARAGLLVTPMDRGSGSWADTLPRSGSGPRALYGRTRPRSRYPA